MKTCSVCRESKPHAEFYSDKSRVDGLCPRCRDCHKAHTRRWAANNRERNLARIRSWKLSNPERVAEINRKSRLVVNQANPLYERLITGRRRTRLAGGKVVKFTATDLLEYWEANGIAADRCYYTGEPLGDDFHLDHKIPLARGGGHTVDNLVPCTPAANLSKGNDYPESYTEGRDDDE